MTEAARSYDLPHERDARLAALGLTTQIIEGTVRRGLATRQTSTAFDPPSAPGYLQWARSHRALRELLVPREWTPDDSRNFSRAINPDRRVAVTIATGDGLTGRAWPDGRQPSTRYPKGAETGLAIEANRQLTLWPIEGRGTSVDERPKLVTWYLLFPTTPTELRYELSCPQAQDEDGRITSWSERILFPPIDCSGDLISGDGEDDDSPGGSIDVPVERL